MGLMPAASGSWSLRRKTGASRIHERERPQVTVDIPNREAYGLVVLHSNALHAIPSPSYKPRAPLCIDCGQRGARRPILRQTSGTCLPIQSGKRGGSYGFRGWYTICERIQQRNGMVWLSHRCREQEAVIIEPADVCVHAPQGGASFTMGIRSRRMTSYSVSTSIWGKSRAYHGAPSSGV